MQHEMGLILPEAGVSLVFVTWTRSQEFGGNAQADQLADVHWAAFSVTYVSSSLHDHSVT